jgi:hypothetical protein
MIKRYRTSNIDGLGTKFNMLKGAHQDFGCVCTTTTAHQMRDLQAILQKPSTPQLRVKVTEIGV